MRTTWKLIRDAIWANLLPGLVLQGLMVLFLVAYALHEQTRHFLSAVAEFKHQAGFLFAFATYVLAAALLPEILRIVFFQSGRPTKRNLWSFLTAAPAWGMMGILVDLFYRGQSAWFGDRNNLATIAVKVVVDQFLFSPFLSNPSIISYFALRDGGFRRSLWGQVFSFRFYVEKVVPIQVAGWVIWIPGVAVVYSMPQLLQIPVAVVIMVFWVLIFTTVGERLTSPKK